MPDELKIRITNYRKVEEHLKKLGAKFTHERDAKDTYYKQPQGGILKVMEADKFVSLINLRQKKGGFDILKYIHVNHPRELKNELKDRHGVKCILQKKQRFFSLGPHEIKINIIKGLGSFIIIEGENLSKDIFTKELKLEKPKFVTKSFAEMKKRTKQKR